MATTADNISLIELLLQKLDKFNEDKGVPADTSTSEIVDKNIIQSNASTFKRKTRLSAILDSVERQRTYNIGVEMARAFLDASSRRRGDTSKPTTIIRSAAQGLKDSDLKTRTEEIKKQAGFFTKLFAAVAVATYLISKFFGPIGEFIEKFILKLPKLFKELKFAEIFKGIKAAFMEGKIGIALQHMFASVVKFISNIKVFAVLKFTKYIKDRSFMVGKTIKSIFEVVTTKIGSIFDGVKSLLQPIFKFFAPAAAKTAGKATGGILKFFKPSMLLKTVGRLLGPFANFALAFIRFQKGDWVRGILELIAGVSALIPGGQLFSLIIDGVLIVSDLMEDTTGSQAAGASAGYKFFKTGMKSIRAVAKKMATKIGSKLLKVLKWIPFVGGVAGLALSYMRFKEGDWLGGIFELISAIADFIPGVGNIVSFVIDGGLILYDLLKTPQSDKKEMSKSSGVSLSPFGQKIGGMLMDVLWYIPGVSGLLYFGQGLSKIFSGDIKDGLIDIGSSILGLVGGKGLVDIWGYVIGLFSSQKEASGTIAEKKVSFADIIGGMIGSLASFISNAISDFIAYTKEAIGSVIESAKKAINPKAAWDDMNTSLQKQVESEQTAREMQEKLKEQQTYDLDKDGILSDTEFMRYLKATNQDKPSKEPVAQPQTIVKETIQKIEVKETNTVEKVITKEVPPSIVKESTQKLEVKETNNVEKSFFKEIEKTSTHTNDVYKEVINNTPSIMQESFKMIEPPKEDTDKLSAIFGKQLSDMQSSFANLQQISTPAITSIAPTKREAPLLPQPSETPAIDLHEQNMLISEQNRMLFDLVSVAKQQLNVTRKQGPPVVINQGEGGSSSNVSMDNAFNSTKPDSRGMYFKSPYSLNANPSLA